MMNSLCFNTWTKAILERGFMEKYIMAIDQGTTSSRAIIFNHNKEIVSVAQKEFTQYFPHEGWVEHDANEIWLSVLSVIATALQKSGIDPSCISGIGITNQRETTVVWNKKTGMPIYNAIVWQSRQTSSICDKLKEENKEDFIKNKTGLKIDPYFSASKIKWILEHVDGAKEQALNGELYAGTIDSWLIYCLTGQKQHVTDYTNASRTLLFNIYDKKWDKELCDLFDVPMNMLPEVRESSSIFGYTAPYHFFGYEVPIAGVAGDQQAALFGQQCIHEGDVKNTYGTGCFLLMNTGTTPIQSKNGLVTTIAWGLNGKVYYALEGSVFVAGSAIQWLRDELHLISSASESEELALKANESNVIVVPAFVGLGAPYWDDKCRGAMFGLTRGTSINDITRATLNALAYQTKDVLLAMEEDIQSKINNLKVDGGASMNNYLMQFQSDLLQCKVIRPKSVETTALGAAFLAGLAVNYWSMDELTNSNDDTRSYVPNMEKEHADKLYTKWQNAVEAARKYTCED